MSSMNMVARNRCEQFGHNIGMFAGAGSIKFICTACGMYLEEIRGETPQQAGKTVPAQTTSAAA